MADTNEDAHVTEVDEDTAVEEGSVEVDVPDEAPVGAPEVGRTELKAIRARLTLEEQAEEARRRVLGSRRARFGPATPPSSEVDDDVDLNERLRELVRGVEQETDRLHDDVTRLRSSA
ncbi:MAG: hypothetical protein JO148_10080, partial [Acidimicrobiia bacterium]|nr:hypothetical protein [Acidimicrobiia bacterium]